MSEPNVTNAMKGLFNVISELHPNARNIRSREFVFILDTLHDYIEDSDRMPGGKNAKILKMLYTLHENPWVALSKLYDQDLAKVANTLSTKNYTSKTVKEYELEARNSVEKILNASNNPPPNGYSNQERLIIEWVLTQPCNGYGAYQHAHDTLKTLKTLQEPFNK